MSLIAIPAVTASRRLRLDPLAWLTAGKVTVGCVLASSFVVPAAGGFHGQALWLRGVVYPIGLTVLPLIWAARGRGRYPMAADAYLLVPFAFDAAGNTLGLYGRIDNFDNFSHLVGTVALTGFAGALLATRGADRLVTILAAAGAAALFGIGIELTEWTSFTHPVATGYGAYRDTIGDLGMDVAGAALGAVALCLTGRAATAFDR
ncbi:MAG TPA: hypothetical protein VM712_10115 [Gaiellales bacterium]|nr:hypothetical protein [Gaiellales bacterium]